MRRTLFILLIVALLVIPTVAQDQIVLDRVDEAMAHLTEYLGLDRPVTRQNSFWRWAEQIYADAGFGCPTPDVAYPATPNRAFQIDITVNTVEYDYRVSGDGTRLVLCGADGRPIYRSDDAQTAPTAPVVTGDSIALPASDVYTWVYLDGTDLFYLLNQNGPVVTIKRPEASGEALPRNVQMVISHDGRHLLQAVSLAAGDSALLHYDFATGTLNEVFRAGTSEGITLGVFNPTSSLAAVGVSQNQDPARSEWRVVVIDLGTSSVIGQITNSEVASSMPASVSTSLRDATSGSGGSFLARPVFLGSDLGLHVQLVLQFAGGADSYPAFAWNLSVGTLEESPYVFSGADVLPETGEMVYAYSDPAVPSLPQDSMVPVFNAIAVQAPGGTPSSAYTNGAAYHLGASWADGGRRIIFRTSPTSEGFNWAMYDLTQPAVPPLQLSSEYTEAIGTVGGMLSISPAASGFDVIYHQNAASRSLIWNGPPRNGEARFVWARLSAATPILNEVALNEWAYVADGGVGGPVPTTPPPSSITPGTGTVVCPGTPPSQMRVGMTGQVTFTTGAPLNIRDRASTSAAVARIIPEGTVFDVVGGPTCADGYTWWQIQLDGTLFGWVAEGDADGYFIAPVPAN